MGMKIVLSGQKRNTWASLSFRLEGVGDVPGQSRRQASIHPIESDLFCVQEPS
jgi:hypothetical protein